MSFISRVTVAAWRIDLSSLQAPLTCPHLYHHRLYVQYVSITAAMWDCCRTFLPPPHDSTRLDRSTSCTFDAQNLGLRHKSSPHVSFCHPAFQRALKSLYFTALLSRNFYACILWCTVGLVLYDWAPWNLFNPLTAMKNSPYANCFLVKIKLFLIIYALD